MGFSEGASIVFEILSTATVEKLDLAPLDTFWPDLLLLAIQSSEDADADGDTGKTDNSDDRKFELHLTTGDSNPFFFREYDVAVDKGVECATKDPNAGLLAVTP